jgi:hypothetical protein
MCQLYMLQRTVSGNPVSVTTSGIPALRASMYFLFSLE